MTKFVFAALLVAVCYSAYRAIMRTAERQREAQVRTRKPSGSIEPRDLGRLRETDSGIYVPDEERH